MKTMKKLAFITIIGLDICSTRSVYAGLTRSSMAIKKLSPIAIQYAPIGMSYTTGSTTQQQTSNYSTNPSPNISSSLGSNYPNQLKSIPKNFGQFSSSQKTQVTNQFKVDKLIERLSHDSDTDESKSEIFNVDELDNPTLTKTNNDFKFNPGQSISSQIYGNQSLKTPFSSQSRNFSTQSSKQTYTPFNPNSTENAFRNDWTQQKGSNGNTNNILYNNEGVKLCEIIEMPEEKYRITLYDERNGKNIGEIYSNPTDWKSYMPVSIDAKEDRIIDKENKTATITNTDDQVKVITQYKITDNKIDHTTILKKEYEFYGIKLSKHLDKNYVNWTSFISIELPDGTKNCTWFNPDGSIQKATSENPDGNIEDIKQIALSSGKISNTISDSRFNDGRGVNKPWIGEEIIYDSNGFDKDGYNKDGFDTFGLDRKGFDKNGNPGISRWNNDGSYNHTSSVEELKKQRYGKQSKAQNGEQSKNSTSFFGNIYKNLFENSDDQIRD